MEATARRHNPSSALSLNPHGENVQSAFESGLLAVRNGFALRGIAWRQNPPNAFRGGLVFKAHRLVYHSTLGLTAIKKKRLGIFPSNLRPFSAAGPSYHSRGRIGLRPLHPPNARQNIPRFHPSEMQNRPKTSSKSETLGCRTDREMEDRPKLYPRLETQGCKTVR